MIKVRGLKKTFGDLQVLKGIDLDIYDGETLVILGKSGQGKSVFLKILTGLLEPDSGLVSINGIDITKLDEKGLNDIRLGMGIVFQENALFDFLTVKENVCILLRELGKKLSKQNITITQESIDKKVRSILKLVGLEGTEDLYPQALSGGMKKRVAIARALILNPSILFYDEPTSGIDPVTASKINFLIKGLHDKLNITSIVVTHDLNCAFFISDRIALLSEGKIVSWGKKEEFLNSQVPEVREFLDSYFAIKSI